MAYADLLRDRVTLQQWSPTADGMGGDSGTWVDVVSVAARVTQLTSRTLMAYGRTGAEHGLRVHTMEVIPRTDGHNSLYDLLDAADEATFRFIHRARTLSIVGVTHRSQGLHNTMGSVMFIDTVETPERVGRLDA